jgi:23S rRNA G2445 N2-methylase RlmL
MNVSIEKRPVRLSAKQAPHRPGLAPALGLRAGTKDHLMVVQPTYCHASTSNDDIFA